MQRYVLTTLDQLVAEDYVLIYFHGATPKGCIPRFSWVKNCYQMIDRRLRKNLKRLYLVHPTLWLKAAVLMCRPFIRYRVFKEKKKTFDSFIIWALSLSTKFSRKIMYIPNLPSLSAELPIDHVCIPDRVKQWVILGLSSPISLTFQNDRLLNKMWTMWTNNLKDWHRILICWLLIFYKVRHAERKFNEWMIAFRYWSIYVRSLASGTRMKIINLPAFSFILLMLLPF